LKNDRENILIHLKNIFQICSNNLDYIQTILSLKINDLLDKVDSILKNSQTIEFQDILSLFCQLNSIYKQINTLPITIPKRPHENDDENLPKKIKDITSESTTCLNEEEQIDDEDIIYIETIQSKSTSISDEQIGNL